VKDSAFAMTLFSVPIIIAGLLASALHGCDQAVEARVSKPLPPVHLHKIADDEPCPTRSAETCPPIPDPDGLDDGVIRDDSKQLPKTEKA